MDKPINDIFVGSEDFETIDNIAETYGLRRDNVQGIRSAAAIGIAQLRHACAEKDKRIEELEKQLNGFPMEFEPETLSRVVTCAHAMAGIADPEQFMRDVRLLCDAKPDIASDDQFTAGQRIRAALSIGETEEDGRDIAIALWNRRTPAQPAFQARVKPPRTKPSATIAFSRKPGSLRSLWV